MAPAMREIHASEANAPASQRLDAAERAQSVALPRRGRAIAQCDGTLPQTSGSQQIPSRKLEEW